ncbi:MAG: SUMF1/EgtB/PvdO family nonheme iron enzyme, partial [Desulfobulbaceae bacterium]|nr:SUMF1/EgtB/PvdO family nonheme iron enzyme [Desulfobulbaceae bacterium]
TLTRGYWLAETAVTQAVWQVVTGENPSGFKGEQNPVEQVSWDDAQGFIKQLNGDLRSSLSELVVRLPTEAEWEHACRAGTDTPFSLGENITPEQVNYNGNFPYADGEKGLYRKKTVPVKSLPANLWGLYEMHGNVWEWCADGWLEHPGEEPVTDPYQETGFDRVLRGGSWYDIGRIVRSAYRYQFSPVGRLDSIGFRLSLGHVSSSRGSER